MIPRTPSLTIIAGPAPIERKARSSSVFERNWRPIICPAISSAASRAITPKVPRAMASGLRAWSALASTIDVAKKSWGRFDGMTRSISDSTVATLLPPWRSWRLVNEKSAQHAVKRRVSAGVRITVGAPMASISSNTTALLNTTVPSRVRSLRRYGLVVEFPLSPVDGPRDGLTYLQVQCARRTLGHHDLVGLVWIGHSATNDGDSVLVEVETIDAAAHVEVAAGLVGCLGRAPVRAEWKGKNKGIALAPLKKGKRGGGGEEGAFIPRRQPEGGLEGRGPDT